MSSQKRKSTRPLFARTRVSAFTKAEVQEAMEAKGLKFAFQGNKDDDVAVPHVLRDYGDVADWRDLARNEPIQFYGGIREILEDQLWLCSSAELAKQKRLEPQTVKGSEILEKLASFFLTDLVPVKKEQKPRQPRRKSIATLAAAGAS